MSKYVIDSQAWVEYLQGSPRGASVEHIINNRVNELHVSPIIIAEVLSVIKRKGLNPDMALAALRVAKVFPIDEALAIEAGLLHAELRKTVKNFALADAFIAVTAKRLAAKIVTGDFHFKEFSNAVMI